MGEVPRAGDRSAPHRLAFVLATVLLAIVAIAPAPASADDGLDAEVVSMVGSEGPLEWRGRRYAGRFEIRAVGETVVLVEMVDPDTYLRGIREVPESWEPEALKAQAVAARTYMAWTLQRGRVGAGATYGFDICATSQCQVYRGGAETTASPWVDAVAATAREILLYDGTPAQALYSSTTGGRTRNIEDVYGSTPKPYLTAVDSPNEDSPFATWVVELTRGEMQEVLEAAGIGEQLVGLWVEKAADGEGAWEVVGLFAGQTRRWTTWQFRGLLNRYGPEALPGLLPARRPDGPRYPQVILSPTYEIERFGRYDGTITNASPMVDFFSIRGRGWGHLVGMSQYGAQAMALDGADYHDVLGHYYSGLRPEPAGRFLPDLLAVGLSYRSGSVTVEAPDGGSVALDGAPIAEGLVGTWSFYAHGGVLEIIPPVSFSVDPGAVDQATDVPSPRRLLVVANAEVGQVRLVVFRGDEPIYRTRWREWPGGRVVYSPTGITGGPGISVVVQHRTEDGAPVLEVPVTAGLLRWG